MYTHTAYPPAAPLRRGQRWPRPKAGPCKGLWLTLKWDQLKYNDLLTDFYNWQYNLYVFTRNLLSSLKHTSACHLIPKPPLLLWKWCGWNTWLVRCADHSCCPKSQGLKKEKPGYRENRKMKGAERQWPNFWPKKSVKKHQVWQAKLNMVNTYRDMILQPAGITNACN